MLEMLTLTEFLILKLVESLPKLVRGITIFNKISLIESKGYKVLTIWESEYRNNPQQTLEKCIKFING
jgi:hypothetical protein